MKKSYEEEFRSEDQYALGLEESENGYFFQRFYDDEHLKRLTDDLGGCSISSIQVFGEKVDGFFRKYEDRWIRRGLKETVKDPFLMARGMRSYKGISSLAGFGVAGLVIEKS